MGSCPIDLSQMRLVPPIDGTFFYQCVIPFLFGTPFFLSEAQRSLEVYFFPILAASLLEDNFFSVLFPRMPLIGRSFLNAPSAR